MCRSSRESLMSHTSQDVQVQAFVEAASESPPTSTVRIKTSNKFSPMESIHVSLYFWPDALAETP